MKPAIAIALLILGSFSLLSCSHSEESSEARNATRNDVQEEHSFHSDRKHLEELRKDLPEEVKKSNDRLAEVLERWKQKKTPPDELKEKFDDEIRKARQSFEKSISRRREDFNRYVTDKRREFQEKQKEEREDFLSEKPKGDRRSHFLDRQSTERTRFNSDLTDERDRFEDNIKEQRKNFEAEIANRRTEFKQEFPEYQRVYKEMKLAEEKEKAEKKANPPPYGGWPYKPADAPAGAPTKSYDVNQGGQGWPASDPAELNQVPNPPKSEQ